MTTKPNCVEDGVMVVFKLKLYDIATGELLADSEEEQESTFALLYRLPLTLPVPVWNEMRDCVSGDVVKVDVPAKDTIFGEYDESKIEEVPLDAFPNDMDIEVGEVYELLDANGEHVWATFLDVDRDRGVAKVDFNHPLAGKDIRYEVEIIDTYQPSDEEKQEMRDYLMALKLFSAADQALIDELLQYVQ